MAISPTTGTTARKPVGRQYPLAILVDFGAQTSDLTLGVTVKLPANSLVVRGSVNVITAFGGTTPKLTVKDNAVSPVSLFGDVAADAVAVTGALTADSSAFYPFGTTLTIAVAGGTVTAGLAYVCLEYIRLGRTNESAHA